MKKAFGSLRLGVKLNSWLDGKKCYSKITQVGFGDDQNHNNIQGSEGYPISVVPGSIGYFLVSHIHT